MHLYTRFTLRTVLLRLYFFLDVIKIIKIIIKIAMPSLMTQLITVVSHFSCFTYLRAVAAAATHRLCGVCRRFVDIKANSYSENSGD